MIILSIFGVVFDLLWCFFTPYFDKIKNSFLGKFTSLKNKNIYFIGDGAGKAGNIVIAAATGLVAARNIIENTK